MIREHCYTNNIQTQRWKLLRKYSQFYSPEPWDKCSLSNVKKVVIIGTSSRGGSSLFMELLGRTPQINRLRGEINPFLILARECSTTQIDYDDASIPNLHRDSLNKNLLHDCGSYLFRFESDKAIIQYCVDFAMRLCLQWPLISFDLGRVFSTVKNIVQTYRDNIDFRKNTTGFFIEIFKEICRIYPKINPYYYDLDDAAVQQSFPFLSRPAGPPCSEIIEEPPFILPTPWQHLTKKDLETKPLILKTPSDAYRIKFIKSLFPSASFYMVHLTRNVAASVGGLIEGWQHHGFFSHKIAKSSLDIKGYSDKYPSWGYSWWKFDLPPGWCAYMDRPLEDVCAFQWFASHDSILRHINEFEPGHYLRVKFEDITRNLIARENILKQVCDFVGIEYDVCIKTLVNNMPVVMKTSQPSAQKWKRFETEINRIMKYSWIKDLSSRLGYITTYGNE